MRDLLVIVPSRGRPDRFAEMAQAALSLSEAGARIAVATDDDDPSGPEYRFSERVDFWQGARNTVAGWTNAVAMAEHGNYRALCSMSDDHLPRTAGWDRLLLEAIDGMGGTGIAYGDDLLQGAAVPTAAVVSADIVGALGWLALPACDHYWIDNAWKALGEGAWCLAYRPDVVIEHMHPGAFKGAWDQTYADGAAWDGPDKDAYEAWIADGAAADIAKVAALVTAKAAS